MMKIAEVIKEIEQTKKEHKEEREKLNSNSHAAYLRLGSEMALDYVIGLLRQCGGD